MGKLRFIQVDVFTASPFGGNPVVVIPDPGRMTREQMQRVARGMNFAETSYVVPPTLPAVDFAIRGFSPTTEVAYSGHQLLGAAWVLADAGRLGGPDDAPSTVSAEMGGRSWPVIVERSGGRVRGVSTLARPAVVRATLPVERLADVAAALSLDPTAILRAELPLEVIESGLVCLVVPVRGLTEARGILPVEQALDTLLQRVGAECLVAFCRETLSPECQAHVRVFAPPLGIVEDPATGAASGALAAYLVRHGAIDAAPRAALRCEQGSEMGRPSRIEVWIDAADPPVVHVGGAVARSAQGTVFF